MKPLLSLWLLLLAAPLAALHAQTPTKVFVASFGNDANDGSRGSPKRNFQAAHNAVATGGQIVVLDTAGYGALAITKSLSVTVPPGVNAFVTMSAAGTDGVNIQAGSADAVRLQGLIIEGAGPNNSGIYAQSLGELVVQDCTVRSFFYGIYLNPVGCSPHFYASNVALRNCNTGARISGAVSPGATGGLEDCRIEENTATGLRADSATGRSADLSLLNCEVSGNSLGMQVSANCTVRLDGCTIANNTTGYTNAGTLASRSNNTFEGNGGTATFPSTYPAQ